MNLRRIGKNGYKRIQIDKRRSLHVVRFGPESECHMRNTEYGICPSPSGMRPYSAVITQTPCQYRLFLSCFVTQIVLGKRCPNYASWKSAMFDIGIFHVRHGILPCTTWDSAMFDIGICHVRHGNLPCSTWESAMSDMVFLPCSTWVVVVVVSQFNGTSTLKGS